MFQLYANVLCVFVRDLATYEVGAFSLKEHEVIPVSEQDKNTLAPLLQTSDDAAAFLWLPATKARKERLVQALASGCTYPELGLQLRMLRETLEDELRDLLVLYMPPGQAVHFYAGGNLLGEQVLERFTGLATDIDEAGKCLGSGRYTAAVFHLMRIVESGVQEFGTQLGIAFTDAKNWHNILEEVDLAIKSLPKTDARRAQMAELSALLGAVKLAWRNEVMHPKATYDAEEAANVLGATKAFMSRLANLV